MPKPSLRQRIGLKLLGGSTEKAFVPPLSPDDGGMGLGRLARTNDYTAMDDQLAANVGWVFAANDAICEPASSIKLKLFKVQKDGDREEIMDHEILRLLEDPNAVHTGQLMRELLFGYLNLTGENYVLMAKGLDVFIPAKGQLPDSLQLIPSHQAQFKLDKYDYRKSTVKCGQEEFPIQSILRQIKPSLRDPLKGQSIIAAAALTIDTEDQMKKWNRSVFANAAQPSLVFKTNNGATMDDAAYERWKAQFHDNNTGVANAGKPLLIENGDVTAIQLSAADLQFLDSRKFSKDELLAMFKVAPGLIGMTENVNRANMDAIDLFHAKVNLRPRLQKYVDFLNARLVKVYDPTLELGFEDPVPEDVEAKLNAADKGSNKWWTIDEVRKMYGDKALPDGLGAKLYLPGTLTTIDAVADPQTPAAAPVNEPANAEANPNEPEAKKSLTGVKKKDLSPEERKRRGDAKVASLRQLAALREDQMVQAVRAQFEDQRRKILVNLDTSRIGKSYTRKDWLNDLLDWAAAREAMTTAIKPILLATLVESGNEAMREIEVEANLFDPFTAPMRDYFENRTLRISQDVNDETEKQLRASLSQGVQNNEPPEELRARIESVMGSAGTVRADRIARSEVARAQGYANIQAWSQSGVVEAKEWFTAEDEHVCPFCSQLDGKTVGLDENFFSKGDIYTAGGQTMKLSYDDIPSAPLHANCRCVLLPVRQ